MYVIKGLAVAFALSFFFIIAIIVYPLFLLNKDKLRPLLSMLVQFVSLIIVRVLNIRLEFDFKKNSILGKTIVCNHQSYLDIPIILSVIQTSFLTSVEIKETPFLGQICEFAGCFFTERRHKKNLKDEVQEFKRYLEKGKNITFFPEGTSTNASEVKKFKKPFFYPATELKSEIVVLTLNYRAIDSIEFSKENRDKICWYGDMEFFGHFIELLKVKSITVHLSKDIHISNGEISKTVDACQHIINENFKTV